MWPGLWCRDVFSRQQVSLKTPWERPVTLHDWQMLVSEWAHPALALASIEIARLWRGAHSGGKHSCTLGCLTRLFVRFSFISTEKISSLLIACNDVLAHSNTPVWLLISMFYHKTPGSLTQYSLFRIYPVYNQCPFTLNSDSFKK